MVERIITTVSGKRINLECSDDQDQIDINDIYHGLVKQCRFNGQVTKNMSVAAHCVNVGKAVFKQTGDPKLALEGLLHDAHEAYTGDLALPIKEWMMDKGHMSFDFLEHRIAGSIMHLNGCTHCIHKIEEGYLYAPSDIVKEIDRKAFEHESYYLRLPDGYEKRHLYLFPAYPELAKHGDFFRLLEEWRDASR